MDGAVGVLKFGESLAQGVAGDDHLLDVGGTLDNLEGFGIAQEAADRVLIGVAVRTVDLHGRVGAVDSRFGGVVLGDGRLVGEALVRVLVLVGGSPVHQQLCS